METKNRLNMGTKPIHTIVAIDAYGTIGHGREMPGWNITDDYKENFTPKTTGNPCIMGSTTASILGAPLKNRPCIAVSTTKVTQEWLYGCGFIIARDPFEALSIAQRLPGDIIWNIGGGKMYAWFRDNVITREIHITKIHATYRGEEEVKFCSFPHDQYELDETRTIYIKKRPQKTNGEKDKGNSDDATVEVYVRKK